MKFSLIFNIAISITITLLQLFSLESVGQFVTIKRQFQIFFLFLSSFISRNYYVNNLNHAALYESMKFDFELINKLYLEQPHKAC